MNTGAKRVLLVVGPSVVTMGVAILIIAITIFILMQDAYSCSYTTRVMLALWVTIAAIFLASVVVVGVVAWRIIPSAAGRLAVVAVYGVLMLASYVVIAFFLLVAFNC